MVSDSKPFVGKNHKSAVTQQMKADREYCADWIIAKHIQGDWKSEIVN